MTAPNFIILYVDQPQRSGAFYSALLGRQPVETSPTFIPRFCASSSTVW